MFVVVCPALRLNKPFSTLEDAKSFLINKIGEVTRGTTNLSSFVDYKLETGNNFYNYYAIKGVIERDYITIEFAIMEEPKTNEIIEQKYYIPYRQNTYHVFDNDLNNPIKVIFQDNKSLKKISNINIIETFNNDNVINKINLDESVDFETEEFTKEELINYHTGLTQVLKYEIEKML